MAGSADALTLGPLPGALADDARQLIARLDAGQRMWLSGYLAGSVSPVAGTAAPTDALPAAKPVTVLFGSQSGNAERVARQAAQHLEQRGVPCVVLDMMDCGKAELTAAHTLLVVVSTQGEGDPPDRALALWELLQGRRAPSLAHLRFSVLALGDSSYRKYCETGRRFDARLEALGATRLQPRIDCDVEFDTPAVHWMEQLGAALENPASPAPGGAAKIVPAPASTASVSSAYTRRNPFQAPLLLNQRLTASGSTKDVRHVELSLEGSGIRYEPGDALGIVPRNPDPDVDAVLAALPFSPEAPVRFESHELSLREALAGRVAIDFPDETFLEAWAPGRAAELRGKLLAEVLHAAPRSDLDVAGFVALLRPLSQRLYSIASSPHATPDEVHLTVGVVEYEHAGARRTGVVSGALATLTDESAHVPVYLHRNTGFRLPAADVPIIMIGPGTGIAPFRGFVADRAATGARGRNWLIFGDRNFETDFLYQSEWLAWRRQGVLSRIDVAFSRDSSERIYVQQRIRENGAELWRWVQEGAGLYVCGDAQRMAPDVHAALTLVAVTHGGLDPEAATAWLAQLQRERRYQRDVY